MDIILLDAGGAGLLFFGLFLLLLFTFAAILLEAFIMAGMKYNLFKKALGNSAIINLASVVVGIICISTGTSIFHLDDWTGYLAFFVVTIVVETLVLYLLNKDKPFSKTLTVSLIMNVITYILLFLVGNGFTEGY